MKRYFTIGVLPQTMTGLLTLAIVATLSMQALDARRAHERAHRDSTLIDISHDLFTATFNIRLERGAVNGALITPTSIEPGTNNELTTFRARSDAAIAAVLRKSATLDADTMKDGWVELANQWRTWLIMRGETDRVLRLPAKQRPPDIHTRWVEANADMVRAVDRQSKKIESLLSSSDSFVAEMMKL